MNEQPPTAVARVRWRPAAIILAVAMLAMAIILVEPDVLRGMHAVATMVVVGVTSILLAIWFFVFSGLSGRILLVGAVAMLASVAIGASIFRLDGWDGAMRPIFTWRWTPTPEERLAASQALMTPARETTAVETPSDSERVLPEAASDYPGFLGADRRGVVTELRIARDWNEHPPRQLWRRPIGLGWSAFAVVEGRCITQEQRGSQEAVVCYELASGRPLWEHVDEARFSEALGGDGPRATPTVHDGRVYALGATGILNCLEVATGNRLWTRNILADAAAENRDWGMAGSPLVVGSRVIVCPGGAGGKSVFAYDCDTGDIAWHAGDDPASYTSPLLTQLAGQDQVLLLTATAVVAYDPEDGQQLWRYPWSEHQVIKCTQPLPLADFGYAEGKDQVLVSSGYTVGSQLLKIERKEDQWSVQPLWKTRQLRAKFSNMIVRDHFVYGLDEGILTCLDLRDGSRQWKQGRYGHGQMILVGDVLLIQAESGDVVLVEASPTQHREVARLPALADKTWNHPALAGPYLLVRNDREAACYELARESPAH